MSSQPMSLHVDIHFRDSCEWHDSITYICTTIALFTYVTLRWLLWVIRFCNACNTKAPFIHVTCVHGAQDRGEWMDGKRERGEGTRTSRRHQVLLRNDKGAGFCHETATNSHSNKVGDRTLPAKRLGKQIEGRSTRRQVNAAYGTYSWRDAKQSIQGRSDT